MSNSKKNPTEEQVGNACDLLRSKGVNTMQLSWSQLENITETMLQFADDALKNYKEKQKAKRLQKT